MIGWGFLRRPSNRSLPKEEPFESVRIDIASTADTAGAQAFVDSFFALAPHSGAFTHHVYTRDAIHTGVPGGQGFRTQLRPPGTPLCAEFAAYTSSTLPPTAWDDDDMEEDLPTEAETTEIWDSE